MQIRTDAIKNMVKERSLNKTKASAPSICAKVVFSLFAFGGVLGRKKLSRPSAADATAAILKVKASWSVEILNTLSMSQPVAIQPIVPNTRMEANSFPGSDICRKATELASARVGA